MNEHQQALLALLYYMDHSGTWPGSEWSMDKIRSVANKEVLFCKRCGKVVPDEFRFYLNDPRHPDTMWGPWCSEECMCYTKICSVCNKDFSEDQGTITMDFTGTWTCNKCKR